MSNLSRLAVVLGAAALALPLAIPASAKSPGASKVISMVDTDNDGTIDRKKALKAADPDSDGTLDKTEFLALVEARFKAADPDNDGTLDAKELKTPASKALVSLLK